YLAEQAQGLDPLPEHLLAEPYAKGDPDAFVANNYFTDNYVGLGPYRLSKWNRGSDMVLERFDRYFLGAPALDQVRIRYITDPNTMVAAILSDAVDVVWPIAVDSDAALDVQDRWKGTDNVVHFEP